MPSAIGHLSRFVALLIMLAAGTVGAHDAHVNEAPWLACEQRQLGNACSYTNSSHDLYRGTCQSMQEHLFCVRNQPIEKASAGGGAGLLTAWTALILGGLIAGYGALRRAT